MQRQHRGAAPPTPTAPPHTHQGQEAAAGAVAADGAVGQTAAAKALHLLLGLLQHPAALHVFVLQVPQLRGGGTTQSTAPTGGTCSHAPSPTSHLRPEMLLHLLGRGQVLLELLHLRAVLRSGGRGVRGGCVLRAAPPRGPSAQSRGGKLTVLHFCCSSTTCARS